MNSSEEIKQQLKKAAKIADPAERVVSVASLVAEALRTIGQDPVLVGGAAVEFYTKGGYSISDIEMIAPGGKELKEMMAGLGFHEIGKDYARSEIGLYMEFPRSSLGPTERFDELEIDARRLRIISSEDLMVDCLCCFKYWKSAVDGVNALLLAELADYEAERVRQRAEEEGVWDAWQAVLEVCETAIREKLSREEANWLLESRMRRLKSKAV